MRPTTLIVPGFHGSGPTHWQSWMEAAIPDARRVRGIDWEMPALARWAVAVRREIDAAPVGVWIVAHSFGCLAAIAAAADRPARVAGLLLVAPAEPQRFSLIGLADAGATIKSADAALPMQVLPTASALVASRNDPWLSFDRASALAARWGGRLIDAGQAGHINADAGFGPWPAGLALLRAMQRAHRHMPLGSVEAASRGPVRGRTSTLARLQHQTRQSLNLVTRNR